MTQVGITSAASFDLSTVVPIMLKGDAYTVAGTFQGNHALNSELRVTVEQEVLEEFGVLRRQTVAAESVELTQAQCDAALKVLAKWGSRTYRRLFNETARDVLARQFAGRSGTPAPTFLIDVKFPWEILHDGTDEQVAAGDPDGFWGLRLAPARVPDETKDVSQYAAEQALPSDMLMCLHHRLRYAHDKEWPAIENVVRASQSDAFAILRAPEYAAITSGTELLRRLYDTPHNMLHFACHCVAGDAGGDRLQVSVLSDDVDTTAVIELDTWNFEDVSTGRFQRGPLIFLNACESAGAAAVHQLEFNLPRVLVERDAGAVIATACAVPDIFGAAFARSFYHRFLKPTQGSDNGYLTIGEALRQTRYEYVVTHKNPLGLAYGLYTPSHYRLAGAPRTRRRV